MIFKKYPLSFSLILITATTYAQSLQQIEAGRIHLPNGWSITPVGKSLPLGDLPLNIAVSPSKKLLAVTNNGKSDQTIQLIDAVKGIVLDSIITHISWLGLTFSDDGQSLYASGGNDNYIMHYAIRNKKLIPADTIVIGKPWPEKISVAGIALDDKRHLLYAVTKENNSLYVLDVTSKKLLHQFPLGGEGYTCLLSPGNKALYISCWGCNKVRVFDTEKQEMSGFVSVGDNPNDMCITANGSLLFAANSNDNSVSVIDLKKQRVIETLNGALYPDAPEGSTTNSVALSSDDKTLYIANADNNCLAVFDVSKPGSSKSKGFIPAGWYPTCVRVVNNTVFVSNGKGFSSQANPRGPNPMLKNEAVTYRHGDTKKKGKVQYIAGLFMGTLGMIKEPGNKQLSIYSQVVYNNTPYHKKDELVSPAPAGNPVPQKVGDASPVKHIFYIIKENRTYDQVLGDVPRGNGDSSLVLFGEKITPNQHALAGSFVLLDNFYVDAEVSADGHNWSTGAYATDYLEKTWPTSYGERGGNYDGEGKREIANNKNGFIWDLCKRHGVTYRTYGEFVDDYKPTIPVLADHFCPYFTGWDESVFDTTRFTQWKRDFDSLMTIDKVPQLNTIRFMNDHTEGLKSGKFTPFAHVADNDLAVGLFVDYLSRSKIWNESVVFIVEDDAQNGPDHVDAHRSPVYIAGGYVKRHFVDHTMYSTSSVLRTMELILGLPPMSQYDAAATPMWRCFADTADKTPFHSKPELVDLQERNTAVNKWSVMSDGFDFTAEDRAPDRELNEVIWVYVKGEQIPCPAPIHAAFIKPCEDDD